MITYKIHKHTDIFSINLRLSLTQQILRTPLLAVEFGNYTKGRICCLFIQFQGNKIPERNPHNPCV